MFAAFAFWVIWAVVAVSCGRTMRASTPEAMKFSIWLSWFSIFSSAEVMLTSAPAASARSLMELATFWRNWSSSGKEAPIFTFLPSFGLMTSAGA